MWPWGSAIGLAAFTLVFTAQLCSGYKCYICSWSPASANRTDICTTKNFRPEAAKQFNGCTHGCEIVATYDTNGELENFYRNCVIKGNPVENECKEESNAMIKKTVCRCDSDLCNAATPAADSRVGLVTLAAAAAVISASLRG